MLKYLLLLSLCFSCASPKKVKYPWDSLPERERRYYAETYNCVEATAEAKKVHKWVQSGPVAGLIGDDKTGNWLISYYPVQGPNKDDKAVLFETHKPNGERVLTFLFVYSGEFEALLDYYVVREMKIGDKDPGMIFEDGELYEISLKATGEFFCGTKKPQPEQ